MNASESNSLTFPVKLKRIVDAPETDHLIYWDEDGLSFHIVDENQLARDVIPNYFKHNNISSFIRQLNMYGFHKINRIENGLAVIGSGKDDSHWSHPQFARDKPDLLQNITRKVTNTPFINSLISKKPNSNNETDILAYESMKSDIAHLAKAVQHLKQRDEETSDKLKTLQEENHQLYSVLMYLREEHEKQSKLIDILIKFFSLYANNPQEARLKSKRVFAIEMPNSKPSNSNEPPKKYLVTSPTGSPQVSVSNHSNNSFKGKKVIKITPTTILNNSRICGIPNITNPVNQKPSPIFSISLPKSKTNVIIPNRAITSNTKSKPTFLIPQIKSIQQNNNTVKKPVAKTVTVSSIDTSPEDVYNAQYFNYPDYQTSTNTVQQSNEYIKENNYFDIDEFLNEPLKKENYTAHDSVFESKTVTDNENDVSDMISSSDISANVTSVGQGLNKIAKCFKTTDKTFPSTKSAQSNVTDINFDLDIDEGNYLIPNGDEVPYDELKMLWENIKNGNLDDNFLVSDPGKIQGNELIPFNTHRNDWQEPVYNYQDNFSIDDLLQTPEIHPEESSLSLDGLKDSLSPEDYFNNISKR